MEISEHQSVTPEVSYHRSPYYAGYKATVPLNGYYSLSDGNASYISMGIDQRNNGIGSAYLGGEGLIVANYLRLVQIQEAEFQPQGVIHHEFTHFLWERTDSTIKEAIMQAFITNQDALVGVYQFVYALLSDPFFAQSYLAQFTRNYGSLILSLPSADGREYHLDLNSVLNELFGYANSQDIWPELSEKALRAFHQLPIDMQLLLKDSGLIGDKLYQLQISRLIDATRSACAAQVAFILPS